MIAQPTTGDVVAGRYRVIRPLGTGGMGTVLEVENERFGGRFALKTLRADRASDPEAIERFRREARAAGSIGHPHIVGVCDVGELADGTPFLVLELLRGRSLARELVRLGKLPGARAAEIARQLCEALGAAHALGIVHRDLKPDNVFLLARRGGDFVKLLDFGVSKILHADPGDGAAGLTETGTALGTPAYMSPEQITASRAVDPRSDLFSLGVLLYQCLTGRLPFEGTNLGALAVSMMTTTPPHPSVVEPSVPVELGDCVMRALSRAPEDRFSTADAFERELSAIAPRGGAIAEAAAGDWDEADAEASSDVADTMEVGTTVAHSTPSARALVGPTTVHDPNADPRARPIGPAPRHGAIVGILGVMALASVALLVGGALSARPTEPPTMAPTPRRPGAARDVHAARTRDPIDVEPVSSTAAITPATTTAAIVVAPAPSPPGVGAARGRALRPPSRPAAALTVSEPRTRTRTDAVALAAQPPRTSRVVHVATEWDEPIDVSFDCGGSEPTLTVSLPPFGTRNVSVPNGDCRVRCSSQSGLPRCPLRLRSDSARLTVRR
ncbi:MAG: protein kinase [Deltaproteobacteria bacterium]|nr:protein kinase [Deltaproteobacteria bacterium]